MYTRFRGRRTIREGAAGWESGSGEHRGAFGNWPPREVTWRKQAETGAERRQSSALQAPLRLKGGHGDAQARAGRGMG